MKWVIGTVGAVFGIWLMFWIGFMAQPWARWWISSPGASITAPVDGGITLPVDLPPIDNSGTTGDTTPPPVTSGNVSDVQRFQLCQAVGLDVQTCIVMTAISIAEDGSGNPSIVSAPNRNGTVDIGIWQINSSHIGSCGIVSQQWLYDPMNNARAMLCILGASRNYCAWSTFEPSCGIGYNGSYRLYIAGATLISQGRQWQH